MNLGKAKTQSPAAFAAYENRLGVTTKGLDEFFDERHIYAVPTFQPGEDQPWGWDLTVYDTQERRFVREQCLYPSRHAAQAAAWTQAFAELERLLTAENA